MSKLSAAPFFSHHEAMTPWSNRTCCIVNRSTLTHFILNGEKHYGVGIALAVSVSAENLPLTVRSYHSHFLCSCHSEKCGMSLKHCLDPVCCSQISAYWCHDRIFLYFSHLILSVAKLPLLLNRKNRLDDCSVVAGQYFA